jgi:hypothetical protein
MRQVIQAEFVGDDHHGHRRADAVTHRIGHHEGPSPVAHGPEPVDVAADVPKRAEDRADVEHARVRALARDHFPLHLRGHVEFLIHSAQPRSRAGLNNVARAGLLLEFAP